MMIAPYARNQMIIGIKNIFFDFSADRPIKTVLSGVLQRRRWSKRIQGPKGLEAYSVPDVDVLLWRYLFFVKLYP